MRALPRAAQFFLVFVCLMGLVAVGAACFSAPPPVHARPWELVLFLALALLAGGRNIVLSRHKESGYLTISLGFAVTFAAMLRLGPAGALLVNAAGCLSACLFPTRQRLHQLLFNISLSVVEAWTAGLVFLVVNGGTLALVPPHTFFAVVASSLLYYLINTGGTSLIIALCTGLRPTSVWRENFLWIAPSYLAGACVSTLVMILGGHNAGVVLLFLSPVAYLMYQSYAGHTVRVAEKQRHIEELQKGQAHLTDLYLATIKSLALAIDAKDQYTHQHILRVQRYAMATAHHLGLTGTELEGLNTGALLHDIGKLGVPEHVLLKPGRLTDEEFEKIKQHPTIGAAILDPVDFPWPVLPVVKYHHEKWDGSGYPSGLAGEDIPLTARILAVADVYDALTSARPYRKAWTHEQALEVIRRDTGRHFDPAISEAFLAVIDDVVAEMAAEPHDWYATQSAAGPVFTPRSNQAAHDIQRASSELWALYEVAQTLSSSLGLQETLDILARKMEAILPGTACLFLLKDSPDGGLTVRAAVGANNEFFLGARTLTRLSRSRAAAENRATYMGEYDAEDFMLIGAKDTPWTNLHSAIIVPIVHQGDVLGTINLYHPSPTGLGDHDRRLLETIAGRAAMALNNARLFDRACSQALTDPLTGLANLRHLTAVVEENCTRPLSTRRPFALLCLDLDSFKPINDNFGHHKGDQVLQDLARAFRSQVREQDIVARYGGDEFLIVLHNAGPEEAKMMAARIQQAVEDYDPGLAHPKLGALRLGVSIGYACFPSDGTDCATLLSAADAQMYHDKMERKLGRLADRSSAQTSEHPPLSFAA
jgi:diguanylate cyclase (GGDEF)-like protein/putative nucleotidyltransferase with HDIG domain